MTKATLIKLLIYLKIILTHSFIIGLISQFITPFLKSDFFIFHETTEGPFIKTKTEYASWSPQENETDKIILFNAQIKKKIENFYQI